MGAIKVHWQSEERLPVWPTYLLEQDSGCGVLLTKNCMTGAIEVRPLLVTAETGDDVVLFLRPVQVQSRIVQGHWADTAGETAAHLRKKKEKNAFYIFL